MGLGSPPKLESNLLKEEPPQHIPIKVEAARQELEHSDGEIVAASIAE